MPRQEHRELNAEGYARQARAAEFECEIASLAGAGERGDPADVAQHSTASQMEKFARLYRRHGENAAAMSQHRERSFTSWEEDDGMVSFRIYLPAEQAAVVLQAIEAAKASLEGHDREDDVSAETFRCEWDGAPPDYGTMVELLDENLRPRQEEPPTRV